MLESLIGKEIYQKIKHKSDFITEIRFRLNKNISLKSRDKVIKIDVIADRSLIDKILLRATEFSIYAHRQELVRGYISYKNGIRIGIGGYGIIENGKIDHIKDITSLNIRVPNDIYNCSEPFDIIRKNFENTLIISPPFCGKTTLIRDFTRELSKRYDVTVIDERLELGGYNGENFCYELGDRTDVISNIPKSLAYENIIRAMSPEIIICDELSPDSDIPMLKHLTQSGVKVLASLHCANEGDFMEKYKEIVEHFEYLITLTNKPKIGVIKSFIRLNV